MRSALEGLRHEATTLYRFVRTLKDYCQDQKTTQTFLPSTIVFLTYVECVAGATLKHLEPLLARAKKEPYALREQRTALVELKELWCILHEFTQPAADSNTLTVPVPLLYFLRDRVRRLPGFGNAEVVTLRGSALNYLDYPLEGLKLLAEQVKGTIAGAPAFPDRMALVAMPYSQGNGLFSNVLLCHELGHFLFEESDQQSCWLDVAIEKALKKSLGKRFVKLTYERNSWLSKYLSSWSEEIFCDLVAVSMIGPAFSFALIHLLNLLGLSDAGAYMEFSLSHPAGACRFKQQSIVLKKLGWWPHIRDYRIEAVTLLKDLGRRSEDEYGAAAEMIEEAGDPIVCELLIDTFRYLLPEIRTQVLKTQPASKQDVRDFGLFARGIHDLLGQGVVPSTLVRRGVARTPSPIAIINGAYLFCLTELGALVGRTGADEHSVEKSADMLHRVEMWALKALEDYRLMHPDGLGEVAWQ